MERNETLEKGIDSMLDEVFGDAPATELNKASDAVHAIVGEPKKSSGNEQKKSPMTADENGAKQEGEEDEKAGKKRGRPDDLSQMSMRDANGASKGSYDSSITSPAKTPANETTVAKSFTISEEEYELLQKAKTDKAEELKKAAEAEKAEVLKKARQENETLIKSAVAEATKSMVAENEALKKSLTETQNLIKSIARKPQARKSVSSIQVLEKSFTAGGEQKQESFSKAEMLDAAERLVKSGALKTEHVIELEDTGYIFDTRARKVLENELQKQ